jgi:hypothetical protein
VPSACAGRRSASSGRRQINPRRHPSPQALPRPPALPAAGESGAADGLTGHRSFIPATQCHSRPVAASAERGADSGGA